MPHTGPNDHQNFPVITGVTSSGGTTTVAGTFHSTPGTTFTLDFYTLSSINPSGYGEGRYVLGSAPLKTDASGNGSFSLAFPTPAGGAKMVAATATDPTGNTSEFSQEFGTNLPPVAVIGFTTRTVDEGGAIFFDGRGSTDPDGDSLTYSWSFGDGGTASDPTAIHIYRQPGTFTVSLTVNDGFGATNTAHATVIVLNVPPLFVPGSYEPPLVLPTPSPGDGYGEAVASVNEAVAVGARFDTGGGAVPAGAVYLYDANPDDTGGLNSIHIYGQLLRVYTDPNPAAGDLFGASVAAVGNNLLIGAPGSSATGPGDGAAYLFDSNPDSPSFGALLATFAVPNPDAAHQAEFGASVASAGTNVVIGAPGKAGGTGEVYVFEGDPTQPTFGSLLIDIASPTAAAHFGASVSGRNIDVLAGAPSDSTAGPGAGAVYLFNGANGALLLSLPNPHPAWPGFGSAVASVGSSVLVGAPQDGTAGPGAGAAFLFDGTTGTLMTSLAQPDGGGGGFGTSVAGSGTTAFVGALVSNLGQADAGAGYLFDADPTSPTFGAAIAVVGAPTPQAASSFGEAVAFSNQALVVGASGAPGSGTTGAEATYVYQPGVPLSLSSQVTFANGSNDSIVLSGTFTDPGLLPISATIDWGDGSAPTVLSLPFGSYAFSAPHRYTDDSVARYSITATLADHYGGTSVSSVVVAVSDPAPSFAAPGLVLSSSSIHENDTVTLSGTIVSPGGIHKNTVTIDWGDGSVPTSVDLDAGAFDFSVPHMYLNQPAGIPTGIDAIHATVVADDSKIGRASTSIAVANVLPQFAAGDLGLSETTANEGDTVTLNGQFTDPGTLDPHTVTIDWGDGSPATVLLGVLGRVPASSTTPGLFTYTASHQYLDNPSGVPTGGTFDIHVSVADDVGTTSADRPIVVNNAPPTVRIQSTGSFGAGTISLTAGATDPGVLDGVSVTWTLTRTLPQGTSVLATTTGPDFAFSTPNPIGILLVTATATDSDGGTGSDTAQIVLILEGNATATITTSAITITQGGNTVESTPTAGADRIIALIYGSDDVVDASSLPATISIELDGYGSNETLIGGSGNDLLTAGLAASDTAQAGANSLVGGAGDDTLVSNLGCDSLYGGSGNDDYRINPGTDPTLVDTGGFNTLDFSIAAQAIAIDLGLDAGQTQYVDPSNDVVSLQGNFDEFIGSTHGNKVTGNADDDIIYGGAGNNTITGGQGNDIIYGGAGPTTITGGHSNDIIYGGSAPTTITGGQGNDIIYGGSASTTITGGQGNDIIYGGSAPTTITGGQSNDIIYGGSATTTITGGQGNDIIYGGSASTTITGGQGNDIIYGGSAPTTITGGHGNDIIYGGSAPTTITGGQGNDIIYGGSAPTTITGGQGNDIIYGGSAPTTITGGHGNDIIYGGSAPTTITGGQGNDIIYGGSAPTTITGGHGNDIIYGGTAPTTITGGQGNDIIYGGVAPTSITAGSGNDIIYGGSASTTITGGQGNDIIYGGSAPTTITGGSGNDIIYGGSADSMITGGSGSTTITGGSGNDIIYGGAGPATITGGSGNDIIYGGSAPTTITGGSGNDIIYGGSASTTITGGSGNDIIYGGSAPTTITGGSGNDIIYGGAGDASIVGGSGDVTIVGGGGSDIIFGGSGNDSIVGGKGSTSILGGGGNDIIYGGSAPTTITGGQGNDIIYAGSAPTTITGGQGNDIIYGSDAANSIIGGSGNDLIYGGSGDDMIDGGTGDATIIGGGGSDHLTASGFDSWLGLYGSMNMNLTDTTLSTSGGGSPPAVSSISGFRNAILSAGPGDFTLDASAFSGNVLLQGASGDDTLFGSHSNDTLVGGGGNDSLVGGGGNDLFVFNGGSSGKQTIIEPAGPNIAGLDFSAAPAGLSINLGQAGPQAVIPGVLTLTLSDPQGITDVLGTPYDDTIFGNARDNTLIGGGGLDLIAGLGGNDVLEGGDNRTVLLDFDSLTIPGEHIYTQQERDAVQAQLTADYSAFSYTFTQTPPSSGPYTTLSFNDPSLVGLEGGRSTGIDWREPRPGGDDQPGHHPGHHAQRLCLGQRQRPAGPGRPARGQQRRLRRHVGHHRRARTRAPLGAGARRLLRPDRLGDLRRGQPVPLPSDLPRPGRGRRDRPAHHGVRGLGARDPVRRGQQPILRGARGDQAGLRRSRRCDRRAGRPALCDGRRPAADAPAARRPRHRPRRRQRRSRLRRHGRRRDRRPRRRRRQPEPDRLLLIHRPGRHPDQPAGPLAGAGPAPGLVRRDADGL